MIIYIEFIRQYSLDLLKQARPMGPTPGDDVRPSSRNVANAEAGPMR
jgi:hypothetical protein